MNYLAHALLSFDRPGITVGNFIADHIKSSQLVNLPDEVVAGVKLHRKIDEFTDSHPLFILSKRYFYDGFERYSGVLADIFFDHLLANNFHAFCDRDLRSFTSGLYLTLESNTDYLVPSAKGFLAYARQNDTFYEYRKREGVELVLKHLSGRINHGIDLSEASPLFFENYVAIESYFLPFMSELQQFAKSELS